MPIAKNTAYIIITKTKDDTQPIIAHFNIAFDLLGVLSFSTK